MHFTQSHYPKQIPWQYKGCQKYQSRKYFCCSVKLKGYIPPHLYLNNLCTERRNKDSWEPRVIEYVWTGPDKCAFFVFCCSFQWSFVVASIDYNLFWLASGTCDLSFNSSFLMIPWTPYWSPLPCPLPFIKHLWNFILTVQTKPTQWVFFSLLQLFVFHQSI